MWNNNNHHDQSQLNIQKASIWTHQLSSDPIDLKKGASSAASTPSLQNYPPSPLSPMSPFHAQNHYYAGKNGNNNNNSASTHSLFSTKSSSSSTSSSSSSTSSFGTHSYTKPNLQSPHQEILNLRHQLHQLQQQQTTLIQRESQLMTTMTQKDEEIRVLQHHLYMAAASLSTQAQTQTQGNKPATSQETANLIASLKQQILSKNKEIYTLREKLQSVQFTPESAIGQRLVARCKMLLAENEELGRKSLFLTKTGQLETEVQEWKHIANTLKASLEDSENLVRDLYEQIAKMKPAAQPAATNSFKGRYQKR